MMLSLTMALAAATAPLPACKASDLSLTFDGEGGAFNGMSQSGTLLVLRNIGSHACSVPGLPRLVLKDAKGKPMPIARKPPEGMHPGPVSPPVGVPAGAELTAALHWVSGPVYPKNECYDVASVALTVGDEPVSGAMGAHICGWTGKGVTFSQAVLKRDPVLP